MILNIPDNETAEMAETLSAAAEQIKCFDCKGSCSVSESEYGCITMKLEELAKKLAAGEI